MELKAATRASPETGSSKLNFDSGINLLCSRMYDVKQFAFHNTLPLLRAG